MKLLTIIFVALIMMITNSYSQLPCVDTGDDTGCTAWSPELSAGFNMTYPQCTITYKYKSRVCNGVAEYMWYNATVTGPCASMPNFSIYHYSFSALAEYIDLLLLQKHYNSNPSAVPICGVGVPMEARTYSANCGVWVSCTWEIEPQNPECERGYAPLPDPAATSVTKSKWMSCGTVCCRKTYMVCKRPDTVQGGYYLDVQSTFKERLTDCTDEGNFDKPCQDGC